MEMVSNELGEEAVTHLQRLIRIDTTNPPGNETPAAQYLADLLAGAGLEPRLLGPTPERLSVVARLEGSGEAAPLLLHAHTDVVAAEREYWRHPPFAGEIHDGYLWGRGAIDMKQMAVMSALVVARLKREGLKPRRDLIFAGVADEEAGCDLGSRWLVDHHPELVRAEFGLGEGGGFNLHLGGREIFPIMVAEKGVVWMKLKARGRTGHGSMPSPDNAVVRLGAAVARLGRARLPQHRTRVVDAWLEGLAATQRFPRSLALRQLHRRRVADLVLGRLPDRSLAGGLTALLSNTAVPTGLHAGKKINVIPGVAEAEVDGRSLPGQSTSDVIAEVRGVVGKDLDIEVLREMPPVATEAASPLWNEMAAAIARHAPGAAAVPYLMPGFSDAKSYARLGCRCYGFMPVRFPDDGTRFADLFHAHDERIPVAGLKWGVGVLYEVVRRFVTAA